MALTNAQRQARWRHNHLREGGDRIRVQLCIDLDAYDRLVRLTTHYQRGATELFEQLAAAAEKHVTSRLRGAALKRYYDAVDDDDLW